MIPISTASMHFSEIFPVPVQISIGSAMNLKSLWPVVRTLSGLNISEWSAKVTRFQFWCPDSSFQPPHRRLLHQNSMHRSPSVLYFWKCLVVRSETHIRAYFQSNSIVSFSVWAEAHTPHYLPSSTAPLMLNFPLISIGEQLCPATWRCLSVDLYNGPFLLPLVPVRTVPDRFWHLRMLHYKTDHIC